MMKFLPLMKGFGWSGSAHDKARSFTQEHLQCILAVLTKYSTAEVHAVAVLALETGMRFSEIASLCWSDVDLDHGFLVTATPCTGDVRVVPLNQKAQAAITRLSREDVAGDDLIFETEPRVLRMSLCRSLRVAAITAGLPGACYQSLRLTFAYHALASGMSAVSVAAIMGSSLPFHLR